VTPLFSTSIARFLLLSFGIPLLLSCSRNIGERNFSPPPDTIYEVELSGPPVTPPEGASLFVGARSSPDTPPIYIRRYPAFPLPLTVYLRKGDTMIPGSAVTSSPLFLFARLDRDSDPATMEPLDLYGESSSAYPLGSKVELRLEFLKELYQGFRFHLRLEGSYPPPPTGAGFVLLLDPLTRAVIAGERFPIPRALPAELTLDERTLFRPPPRGPVEVYVKLDDDGDPSTPGPKDLRGAGVTEGTFLRLTLSP
jgi:hypothetical protein